MRIYIRFMRTSIKSLFPKIRAELLAALVLHPERWWFQADLAKHLGVSPSALQRELKRMSEAGILLRRVDGRRVYYKADPRCPFLSELQGLFLKTAGMVDVVAEALKKLRSKISTALVFGSIARGDELSRSDVDLLVVGELGLSDLTPALKRAEAKLAREIQAIVYRPEEFRAKLKSKDHFLTSVLDGPTLPIIGTINDQLEATSK